MTSPGGCSVTGEHGCFCDMAFVAAVWLRLHNVIAEASAEDTVAAVFAVSGWVNIASVKSGGCSCLGDVRAHCVVART